MTLNKINKNMINGLPEDLSSLNQQLAQNNLQLADTDSQLNKRIDNIIATPTTVSEQEIIDARQGELSLGSNIRKIKKTTEILTEDSPISITNLFENGNFTKKEKWSASSIHEANYSEEGFISFTNLQSSFWAFYMEKQIYADHKYYVTFDASYTDPNQIGSEVYTSFRLFPSGTVSHNNVWSSGFKGLEVKISSNLTKYSAIFTPTTNYGQILIGGRPTSRYNYQLGNIMLIDLTEVFGYGNEPTKEEFESMIKSAGKYFGEFNRPTRDELKKITEKLSIQVDALSTKKVSIDSTTSNLIVDVSKGDIFSVFPQTTDRKKLSIKGLPNNNTIKIVLNCTLTNNISLPYFIVSTGLKLELGQIYEILLSTVDGGMSWNCSFKVFSSSTRDSFDRENNTMLGVTDSGDVWLYNFENRSKWTINEGVAINTTTDGTKSIAYINSGLSDCDVKATFVPVNGANNRLVLRYNPLDESYISIGCDNINRLCVAYYRDDRNVGITAYSDVIAQDDVVIARLIGSAIYIFINGHLVKSIRTSFNLIEKRHGIFSIKGGGFKSFEISKVDASPIEYGEIIYSAGYFQIKSVGTIIYLSADCGRTWLKKLEVSMLDNIQYVHVFENGELLIADNLKTYYSQDWEFLHESVIYDIDGSVFTPKSPDNFHSHIPYSVIQRVNGTEVRVWGNYSRESATQYQNIRVWYTIDKGKTIKCCYKFGATIPDGKTEPLNCRHVHGVAYNDKDQSFWIQTGDEDRNLYSHWIKGFYDIINDVWNWEWIGSGDHYKTTTMYFIDNYIYYAWDVSGGGISRVKYEDVKVPEKHERVFSTANDTIGFHIGERGDMIVICSTYGGGVDARNFYYSPDGKDWYEIIGESPDYLNFSNATYYNNWSPNAEGKILAGIYSLSAMPLNDWKKKPSIWLDEIIKNAGFKNAFSPLRKI